MWLALGRGLSPHRAALKLSPRLLCWPQPKQLFATEATTQSSGGSATGDRKLLQRTAEERRVDQTQIRTYKPRTPGLRHLQRPINDHLWKGKPFRALTFPKKGHGKGGRNNSGRITVQHRGGGAKRRIRIVDYFRWSGGVHVVERIEYDPNRSAHLALLSTKSSGIKSYIIAPEGIRPGDEVRSFRPGLPKSIIDAMGGIIDEGILASKTCLPGNCLPIELVPVGTLVHNIGSHAKGPAMFCRSAGTYGVVIGKGAASPVTGDAAEETDNPVEKPERSTEKQVLQAVMTKIRSGTVAVRLQSGEVRMVSRKACATIGSVSNPLHNRTQLGKAGRKRWLNIRPTVRGVAMNRVDHPHGGGRGKSKSRQHPQSPWGQLAKGFKTRNRRNKNAFLLIERPRGMGPRKSKKNEVDTSSRA